MKMMTLLWSPDVACGRVHTDNVQQASKHYLAIFLPQPESQGSFFL